MDVQCREALRTLMQHCPEVADWATRLLDGDYSVNDAKTVGRWMVREAQRHSVECLKATLIILRCIAMKYPRIWGAVMQTAAGSTATATGAAGGAARRRCRRRSTRRRRTATGWPATAAAPARRV